MNQNAWKNHWEQCLVQVGRELTLVDADERQWLVQHLELVVECKLKLHDLFRRAEGLELCRGCDGACCARGQHHMTLVEVLTSVVLQKPLPRACAEQTCPFLSREGCLLEPGLRPFNCVTFNCEQVEGRLDDKQREEFYRLEGELRELYKIFESRYDGASLRGLVIRSQRLGGRKLLARAED